MRFYGADDEKSIWRAIILFCEQVIYHSVMLSKERAQAPSEVTRELWESTLREGGSWQSGVPY